MAKPDLGTKRLCGNCGAKFYDLNKTPIVCPKCETVFVVAPVSSRAARPEATRGAAPADPDTVTPETADAEFVSLEEADAETSGKGGAENDADDIEIDPAMDDGDDAFIEEQEEGEDDVTDIIGDVDKEEEA